jgi:hypothetical protein
MASATVTRPDVFPNGTSVAAYPATNQSEHGRAGGTADDTKTVSSDSAAFTTLTAGRSYVLVGDNGKTLRLRTVETNTGLAATALMPSWRARRRALGLI